MQLLKKNIAYAGLAVLLVIASISHAKVLRSAEQDEITTFKNSTLVVVLLEESQKYEAKMPRARKAVLLKAYQGAINTINSNMQAMVPQYLKMTKSIEYKTMSEVIAMPAAQRAECSFLVYDRSTQYGQQGPSDFMYDFYTTNQEELQGVLDDYLAYIQFDCANPRYHGEDDYRRINIIVKGKKDEPYTLFSRSLDMIIPTKGSFALCLMDIQNQFHAAEAGKDKISKEEDKEKIREQVAIARTKTLLVCKDNLARNVNEIRIKKVFKYNFKIVTRAAFDSAILQQDTNCCLLVVYPAAKIPGAYRPMVEYQHLIVFPATADVLVTVTPQASAMGMLPDYKHITYTHFTDIVKTEDEVTK